MRWITEDHFAEQMASEAEPYLAARRETGFDLPSLSLRRQTAGTRAPILFLRGEGDDLVPAAEAERLLWIAGKESRLLRLRSGHGDGFRRDRETYLRGLFAFFTGCSGSPQTP